MTAQEVRNVTRLLIGLAWLAMAAPTLAQAPSNADVTIDLGGHRGTFYLPVPQASVCEEYSMENGRLSRSFTRQEGEEVEYTSTYSFQEEGGVIYAVYEWVRESESFPDRSEAIYRVLRASEDQIQLADSKGNPQGSFFASRIQCLLELERSGP